MCAFLVRAHQPRVSRDIGGEDCRETAFDPTWRASLHGLLPDRAILYRGTPMRTTGEGPFSTRPGHSLASRCHQSRLTKTPMIRPAEVHKISGIQPSRLSGNSHEPTRSMGYRYRKI